MLPWIPQWPTGVLFGVSSSFLQAWYRRGQACADMKWHKQAIEDLEQALFYEASANGKNEVVVHWIEWGLWWPLEKSPSTWTAEQVYNKSLRESLVWACLSEEIIFEFMGSVYFLHWKPKCNCTRLWGLGEVFSHAGISPYRTSEYQWGTYGSKDTNKNWLFTSWRGADYRGE